MTSEARDVVEGFLDLIYPPKCLVCQTFNPHYICDTCISQIGRVELPYCPRCGQPMIRKQCRNCWGRVRSFTAARAVGHYGGVLREAIHEFKYGGRRMLADLLAEMLHRYLTVRSDFPWRRADCIIPMPIHHARERIRGYNQSELICRKLTELTGLPTLADAVHRHHTRPQVELSGDERRKNVHGAFYVPDRSAVNGKVVLLVDDVATTCSTIHECSLALIDAGARRVYVVCLAFGA